MSRYRRQVSKRIIRELRRRFSYYQKKLIQAAGVGAAAAQVIPFKIGNPFSQTSTETKTEEKMDAEQENKGVGYTARRVSLYKKPKRFYTKQKSKLSESFSNVHTANAGARMYKSVAFIATVPQLMCEKGSTRLRDDIVLGSAPYIDMCPNAVATGSYMLGTNVYNQQEVCVDSCFLSLTLKNFTSAVCVGNVTLWKCKVPTTLDPVSTYNDLMDIMDGGLAPAVQPATGTAGGGTRGRGSAFVQGGGNSCPGMSQYWQRVSNVKVQLGAAATEVFNFKINHNLVMKTEYCLTHNSNMPNERPAGPGGWSSATVTNAYIPGTLCLTIDFVGTPVQDGTTGVTSNLVTTGSVQVGGIVEKTTTLSWSREAQQATDVVVNYNELPSGTAPANQRAMNIDDMVDTIKQVLT